MEDERRQVEAMRAHVTGRHVPVLIGVELGAPRVLDAFAATITDRALLGERPGVTRGPGALRRVKATLHRRREPETLTRGSAAEVLANLSASDGGPLPGEPRSGEPGGVSAAPDADRRRAGPGGDARIGELDLRHRHLEQGASPARAWLREQGFEADVPEPRPALPLVGEHTEG